MRRLGERTLLRKQTIKGQIAGVAESLRKVAHDAWFDGALIDVFHLHLPRILRLDAVDHCNPNLRIIQSRPLILPRMFGMTIS